MKYDNDNIIWRVVSWKNISGGMAGFSHRQYMFDDLVSEKTFGGYIKILTDRGIESFRSERLGTLEYVLEKNLHPEPRPGTKRIALEKKIHKLEEYLI